MRKSSDRVTKEGTLTDSRQTDRRAGPGHPCVLSSDASGQNALLSNLVTRYSNLTTFFSKE